MDLHQLRVFVAVYRLRSFSRASEQIHLTQPTVSDHIKSLEEEFGCLLFDRLGRTIMPTSEADVLYIHAQDLLEAANLVKDEVRCLKKDLAGELVVGASTIPGTYVLPWLVASFRQRHRTLSFKVLIADSKEIVQRVLRHDILIGIVGARLPDDQLSLTPFMEDSLVVIAPPATHVNRTLSVSDIAKQPMVLREEGSGTRREIEKAFETRGVGSERLNIAGVFGSNDAIKQAVRAGLGIAILSRLAVADDLRHGLLREIRLRDGPIKRKFFIVTHRKRTLPAAYAVFLEHAKATYTIRQGPNGHH